MGPWDRSGGAPYAVGSSSPSACTTTSRLSVSCAFAVMVAASKRITNAACEEMRNKILIVDICEHLLCRTEDITLPVASREFGRLVMPANLLRHGRALRKLR